MMGGDWPILAGISINMSILAWILEGISKKLDRICRALESEMLPEEPEKGDGEK